MFVAANYTFGLWTTRGSLGEFWAYALIPWVVSGALSEKPGIGLVLAFFLQITGHPIVFAHSMLCEVPAVLGLSRLSPLDLLRRTIGPLIVALILASPFWLPQVLWEPLIMGPAVLPADFRDSFQGLIRLLDPKNNRNIGIWIPLAIVTMIAFSRGRLPWRAWMLVGAWALLMALQTRYLAPITVRIPTLSLSLFVWRLMLPAAFLGFAALFAGWPAVATTGLRGLPFFASAAVLSMAVLSILAAADYVPHFDSSTEDFALLRTYDTDAEASIWGIREYWPNYAHVAQSCPPAGEVSVARYGDLKVGLKVTQPFVAVERGPVGMVTYSAGGVAIQPSACDTRLVLGPLPPGTTLRVSETKLNWLMALRGIFIAGLAIVLGAVLLGRIKEGRIW